MGRFQKTVTLSMWAGFVIIFGLIGLWIWAQETGVIRYECVDHGVVETIDKVNYRTAFFTLTDGRTGYLSQPRDLVPGKEICLHQKRIYDF